MAATMISNMTAAIYGSIYKVIWTLEETFYFFAFSKPAWLDSGVDNIQFLQENPMLNSPSFCKPTRFQFLDLLFSKEILCRILQELVCEN